ncbi:hypothetical protein [Phenylobacterium sp.]|jgi:hypothetical protein|uniref:hypothetical protein n=1 Tax=Phenylobacterium sp. TaxID=1871053 RepID=UPI002E335306|nr:hypothetical protein [Phenylobacterium sp.]HEX3363982.1 hypothetical protein [Phenylobacterium sp.]
MSDATRRERQDAVLSELSELGLTLARELHARALAAETPQEADKLALAFQRVSRGVRQTFALELKIERARAEDDREAARQVRLAAVDPGGEAATPLDPEAAERQAQVGERFRRVRGALNRLMWDEAERDEEEFEILSEDLENRLDEAARREDFLDIPIDTLIRQLKSDMGLSGDLRLTASEAPRSPPPAADLAYAAPPNTG